MSISKWLKKNFDQYFLTVLLLVTMGLTMSNLFLAKPIKFHELVILWKTGLMGFHKLVR